MRALAYMFILLLLSPADARPRGTVSLIAGPDRPTQINIGGADLPGAFINFMKTYQSQSFPAGTNPSDLDTDGYPITTLAGNIGGSIAMPSGFAANGVDWVLRNTGTRTIRFVINVPVTKSAQSGGASTTGGSNSTMTVTLAGVSTVTFSFNNFSNTNVSFFFPSGFANVAGTGTLELIRSSDLAAYTVGDMFTPEFIAMVGNLRPNTIRPMGWTSSNDSNETQWRYRVSPSSLSWLNSQFPTGAWGGTVSGTDTYTMSAAPDTPAVWTDGETIQGRVTNANTSTTPTLNVNGRGAKTITNTQGLALSAGNIAAGSLATFVYDGVLDAVLWKSNGISTTIPIEAQVSLANKLNVNLWTNSPPMVDDTYVTNWATYVRDNLNSVLKFYPEYSNEMWNFQFPGTQWGYQRGLVFGFPNSSSRPINGYFGIRNRQIMGDIIPTVFLGQMSRVRRTLMYQAGGNDSQTTTYRMGGADLAPSGVSTGTGNAAYSSFTGSANYTTSPNRPIDVVEVIGYAPYAGGTNLCTGQDVGCTPNAANATFYQSLIALVEAGNTAAVVSAVDDDIQQGLMSAQTVTASGTTFTTPLVHGFVANTSDIAFTVSGGTSYSGLVSGGLYRVTSTPTTTTFTMQAYIAGSPGGANINAGSAGTGVVMVGLSPYRNLVRLSNTWFVRGETIAALYDGDRPIGMLPLRQEQYEGGLEPKGPSAAQCVSLGVVTVPPDGTGALCAAEVEAGITLWKNDNVAGTRTQQYFNQYMGRDPTMVPTYGLMTHSIYPSWLTITGPNIWSLLPGNIFSTPYKTYDGFKDYNFLLKRDLDPTSNDNDPVWLEKAA